MVQKDSKKFFIHSENDSLNFIQLKRKIEQFFHHFVQRFSVCHQIYRILKVIQIKYLASYFSHIILQLRNLYFTFKKNFFCCNITSLFHIYF